MAKILKVFIVGATGATGSLLTKILLARGIHVVAPVRSANRFSQEITNNNFTLIPKGILELTPDEITEYISDCDAIVSCLGHTLSFKGIFGPPYRLVTDATQKLCQAIMKNSNNKVKYILMNSSGNSNRDLYEPISIAEKFLIFLIRTLIPPHADNEKASDYLRSIHSTVEWVTVRPDGLINEKNISPYTTHPSPTRSAIFNAGKVSRINVAHFMAELITNKKLWETWKGQMPVIYSADK